MAVYKVSLRKQREAAGMSRDALAVAKKTIETAWVDESLRRLAAYQRGEMPAYSLEEVITDLEGRTG